MSGQDRASASAAPIANPARGECAIAGVRLRPSFAALVAAEAELGALFALVERAAAGKLTLAESIALLWHLIDPRPAGLTREAFGEAVCAGGMGAIAPVLGSILRQIVQGQ